MVVMTVPGFGTLLLLYALVFGVPVGAWLLGCRVPGGPGTASGDD